MKHNKVIEILDKTQVKFKMEKTQGKALPLEWIKQKTVC